MGWMRGRRPRHSLEMSEFHTYQLGLAKSDFSIRCQKQRRPVIKSKCRENASPLFFCCFIAVAMGIRFIIMVTIWSAVFLNSLFNQEVQIPLTESYCGPCPKTGYSKNWYESQASCMSQNASLLKVYSKEDQDLLKLVKSYHWMGLVHIPINGSWQWEDGSILSSNLLTIIEMQKGDCALYASSFKGYIENCSTPNTYICMQRTV
uniref:NKG2-D type II integral membrane protein n=1 Tax=Rhinopithecus bieti TaxID=61621 RepID=A0A2K6MBE5_RHIBE